MRIFKALGARAVVMLHGSFVPKATPLSLLREDFWQLHQKPTWIPGQTVTPLRAKKNGCGFASVTHVYIREPGRETAPVTRSSKQKTGADFDRHHPIRKTDHAIADLRTLCPPPIECATAEAAPPGGPLPSRTQDHNKP